MYIHIYKHMYSEAFECPLREWITEDRTRREIQRRFKMFLLTFFTGIEEVSRWRTKTDRHDGNTPNMPSHLKVLPPVYAPKIRYVDVCMCMYVDVCVCI